MPSRRQQKVARVIKESVSDTICNRLSDPRIKGIVSVTEVDVSPDMRNADVFLSIMAESETQRKMTFTAIEHATGKIQAQLKRKMTSKYCPKVHVREDTKLKNTLETLRLIEEAASEYRARDEQVSGEGESENYSSGGGINEGQ